MGVYDNFVDMLKQNSDCEYKSFSERLTPRMGESVGVRVPVLKDFAKKAAKGEYMDFINRPDSGLYEERLVKGLIICYINEDIETRIRLLKDFLNLADNWAVCDVVSCAFKFKKKDSGIVFDFVKKYISNEAEFKKRFAVVMILAHFVDENYIDEILKMLNNINDERFYVSMARAWALSVCFVKFEEKTYDILKNGDIDKATLNRAISKINQSKRVSVSAKERVKKLRA